MAHHEHRDLIGQIINVGDTVVCARHNNLMLATVTALGEETDHRLLGEKAPSLELLLQAGSIGFAWARDVISLRRIA